jgi:hypothetical protein
MIIAAQGWARSAARTYDLDLGRAAARLAESRQEATRITSSSLASRKFEEQHAKGRLIRLFRA